jgi:dephospho-CoA kinase
MLRVGLTGGIASGKSTVGTILRDLGCHVFDADKIAHGLMEPGGGAYREVVREFGAGILTPDGRVDRSRLGKIVFADPGRLKRLNAIVHPRVLKALDLELAALERAEPEAIAVVEAALLIESGYHRQLDCLVVTWCTPEQQLERLTRKWSGRELTPEQARQRIAAQMPTEMKRRLGHEEIDCSGSLEHTREQVAALVARLKRKEAARGAKH